MTISLVIARQTPMLEELSGPSKFIRVVCTCHILIDSLVLNGVLSQCIPNLQNLQRLNVYRGEALEGVGSLIQTHCPLFKALQFYGWYGNITKISDSRLTHFQAKG